MLDDSRGRIKVDVDKHIDVGLYPAFGEFVSHGRVLLM